MLDLCFDLSCGNVSDVKGEVKQADLGVDCSARRVVSKGQGRARESRREERGRGRSGKIGSVRRGVESNL